MTNTNSPFLISIEQRVHKWVCRSETLSGQRSNLLRLRNRFCRARRLPRPIGNTLFVNYSQPILYAMPNLNTFRFFRDSIRKRWNAKRNYPAIWDRCQNAQKLVSHLMHVECILAFFFIEIPILKCKLCTNTMPTFIQQIFFQIGKFAVETNCSCFYTCQKGIDEQLMLKLHECPSNSLFSPKLNQCSYSCKALPTEVKNEYDIEPSERDAFPPCSKPGKFR